MLIRLALSLAAQSVSWVLPLMQVDAWTSTKASSTYITVIRSLHASTRTVLITVIVCKDTLKMVSIALILMNTPLTFTLAAKIEHVATHLGRTNVFAIKNLTAVFQSMAAFRGVIEMPFALKSMVHLFAGV